MGYFLITEVNLIVSLLKSLRMHYNGSSCFLLTCLMIAASHALPKVKQFEYVHFSSKGLVTLWNSVHLVGLPTRLIY